jgi:xanthine/uracil permease
MGPPCEGRIAGEKMRFDYDIDQRIPLIKSVLFGIQWAAVLIPSIIILGIVACNVHSLDAPGQINYLQKLFLVSGAALFFQIFLGHKLPLIPGPSAVLLIGVVAGQGAGATAIYTSVIIGGLFIALLSIGGLFKYLQRLFTVNVITVVLLLIAFTLAPTIMGLIIAGQEGTRALYNISFALGLILMMFLFYGFLKGMWRATLIIWAVIAGAILYYAFFPSDLKSILPTEGNALGGMFHITTALSFQPGLILSFIFCFLALSINDLGSMQAVNELLETKDPDKRISKGIFITGLTNVFSGFLGVIGPVNYSMSPGIIISSGCASRFSLIPTACISLLLAFLPMVVGIIINAPSVVIGALMAYLMGTQVASGLVLAVKDRKDGLQYEDALVIGASVLLGVIAVFVPDQVIKALHPSLKPLLGNGLVVGVVSAIILEHIILKKRSA